MSLTIQLPKFEGPLALLLYLIRKEEMDIMDIKVNQITSQYLEYIKLMKELDLELAGEFIAMAATLIHIKSRMLLPQYDENGELVEHEDPRKELVKRLLEYQKYQEAGKSLYERPLLGRDVYARGIREKLGNKEEEIVLEENALFSLITAYRSAMRSIKSKVHQVAAKTQSIASRILEFKDRLVIGLRITMSELMDPQKTRKQVLITFLSLLELGKIGVVNLYQTEAYQEIYIETKKSVDDNIGDHVEEYDSVGSDQIANAMSVAPEEEIPEEELVSLATDEEIMAEDIGEVNG
jgi:segregation and condensation protein A